MRLCNRTGFAGLGGEVGVDMQSKSLQQKGGISMYQSIPAVAYNLGISEELIDTFLGRGWISEAQKDGLRSFWQGISNTEIRFIQHLREKMDLSDEQVSLVLRYEQPPYTLEQVESILQAHQAAV
jgi:hypothetical protein